MSALHGQYSPALVDRQRGNTHGNRTGNRALTHRTFTRFLPPPESTFPSSRAAQTARSGRAFPVDCGAGPRRWSTASRDPYSRGPARVIRNTNQSSMRSGAALQPAAWGAQEFERRRGTSHGARHPPKSGGRPGRESDVTGRAAPSETIRRRYSRRVGCGDVLIAGASRRPGRRGSPPDRADRCFEDETGK